MAAWDRRRSDLVGQPVEGAAGCFPERCFHRAGEHDLDANALFGKLLLQGERQGDDERLRRAVYAVEDFWHESQCRRHADDRSVLSSDERRRDGIGQTESNASMDRPLKAPTSLCNGIGDT